jgi:hypothetical protein
MNARVGVKRWCFYDVDPPHANKGRYRRFLLFVTSFFPFTVNDGYDMIQ